MAAPSLTPGTYVQLNPTSDSPRAQPPSAIEQTIGVVRQSFFQQGEPYYQVVWNPGDARPKIGMYHESELTVLTQQQSQDILNQLAAGTYTPNTAPQGSTYQPAALPTSAIPPQLQTNQQVYPSTSQS